MFKINDIEQTEDKHSASINKQLVILYDIHPNGLKTKDIEISGNTV